MSHSSPAYPFQRSGTALVCGHGWCLEEDVEEARRLRPAASFVIAVNMAGKIVHADAIFSTHFNMMPQFVNAFLERWGEPPPERHSSGFPAGSADQANTLETYGQHIDYWWPETRCGGSSGARAARLAHLMGFEEIILCGVPLSDGDYADGHYGGDWRKAQLVADYQRGFADIVREMPGFLGNTRSMSGYTRELLGAPE